MAARRWLGSQPGLLVLALGSPGGTHGATGGRPRRRRRPARRPGSHRLLVLLTVATALLGFAVAGLDVAGRARHERAAIETGAPTVVEVDPVDARTLLNAVRSVDPAGTFAMPVAQAPPVARNLPPVLAVDVSRLATVAVWRAQLGMDPARLAALLRPPAPPPFVLRGTEVAFDLEDPANADGSRHTFVVTFAPFAGGPAVDAVVDELAPGRRTYTVPVTQCADGCRLVSLRVVTSGEQPLSVTLHAVREGGTNVDIVPTADIVDATRWRSGTGTLVEPEGDGLKVLGGPAAAPGAGLAPASDAQPVDAPVPLPVATAGADRRAGNNVVGFDQGVHQATVVARLAGLPGWVRPARWSIWSTSTAPRCDRRCWPVFRCGWGRRHRLTRSSGCAGPVYRSPA